MDPFGVIAAVVTLGVAIAIVGRVSSQTDEPR
jgi:hypothetical protein